MGQSTWWNTSFGQHGSERASCPYTSFGGQCKKTSPNIKTVRVQDILTIVQASLSTHVFKAVNQIWVQHCGAGIGSHISPSLSNLAVTLTERSWRNAYSTFIQSSQPQLLFTRYVDNRFILFCLTTVFAPHCPCKCFPIVSFFKRRWSWKPSKMVHSLGSPSMWCNEP